MIMYGVTVGVSVTKMFTAGFIRGLYARRRPVPV